MLRPVVFVLPFVFLGVFCFADDAEQRIIDRYWEILVSAPKRGTAFDRVYGHYVDVGQSALLYQDCQQATQNDPADAGAWILFGLVAERRHQGEQAAKAFQTAAELEPSNHLPMLYLGELLLNQRRIHEAISALEKANERLQDNSGSRQDRRAVLQTLALAYTRFGDPQQSLDVWNQLAALFPNDPDILVQVAETMESDGRLDEALKQYRRLVAMTDDPAERVHFSLAAIDVMFRQRNVDSTGDIASDGNAEPTGHERALNELDALLGLLDSESYLADAVRDRIDRIFERERNVQRHIEFYQRRVERNPNDTPSLLRLVQTFQKAGQNTAAENFLREAIIVAPSTMSLRLALIDLLAEQGKISRAIDEFQAMDRIVSSRSAPMQAELLIRWGTLVLQNPGVTESVRRTEAVNIWNRIAERSPNDPLALVQLADLLLRHRFYNEAEQYYKAALALRPNDFAYREYLAMFYHQRHRKEDFLATLLPTDNPSFQERHRAALGQLLLAQGYLAEARQILQEAVQSSPQDWTLQYRYLEVLLRLETAESLSEVGKLFHEAERNIADDEQFSIFLQQKTQLLRSLHQLPAAVKIVQANAESSSSGDSPSIRTWWHLAVLYQAEGNFSAAIAAVERGILLLSQHHSAAAQHTSEGGELSHSLPSERRNTAQQRAGAIPLPLLRFAAELYEQSGYTNKAIALYQQLTQDDPARSGDHWKQIITLHIQRGELPQALESSQRLLGRGTGSVIAANADRLRFVADLFLSVGRQEEAVQLLQRALIHEPGNADVLRLLARTLSDLREHEEAIELLWRLYERLEYFPAKLSVIEILANEHSKLGKSDDLIEHLQLLSRNHDRRRETMQALVRVFTLQGEDEEAQAVLENLLDLPDDPRTDAEFLSHWVLRELVALAERQGNYATAVHYQEILCQKSPNTNEQNLLFYLYDKLGDREKTRKLFFDQVLRQGNLQDRLDLIDTMIRQEQYELVAQVLDFLEIHEPEHWQIKFRQIMVAAYQNKSVESLVWEFRTMRVSDFHQDLTLQYSALTASPLRGTPPMAWDVRTIRNLMNLGDKVRWLITIAPDDLSTALDVQTQFLPVLFQHELRHALPRARLQQPPPMVDISFVQTFQDARFLVLGFLLREAMNKDVALLDTNSTVMRHFRNTVETLRDMLPADSAEHNVLMERLRLEVWLLDLVARFNTDALPVSRSVLNWQIDQRSSQQTIWHVVRKAGLDGLPDWQPALFQILVTECINELVTQRFKTVLPSDARLLEKLSQILDALCHEHRTPPFLADARDEMLYQASYLVKQSQVDHEASLRVNPLSLSQKTDRLLSIWTEYIENGSPAMREKYHGVFASRYAPLLWIVRSQNREEEATSLEESLRKTAQHDPRWFAAHIADFTRPVDEDRILFLSLTSYDSLEAQLHRLKTAVADVVPFCTETETKREFGTLLLQYLHNLLYAGWLQRYDIFTPSEWSLFEVPTPTFWRHLHAPISPQRQHLSFISARQFFGIDPGYAARQEIFDADRMSRLVELDRSLQQMVDLAFYLLNALKLEPADFSPPLVLPANERIALTRYRMELQGDRPIDRAIIYSLVQDPVNNVSVADDLFFRILLFRRAMDMKTKFAGTRMEGQIVPIRKNYTQQFARVLENRKRSTIASDRIWSHHLSAIFGDLLQVETLSSGGVTPGSNTQEIDTESSSDAELLQLVRNLESKQRAPQEGEGTNIGNTLTLAEKTALALLYVRLQRFEDAVTMLDSMELNSVADLPVREWIIAHLAVKHAKPDSTLHQRGSEAANRLLHFRLSERDSLNLVPMLQHFHREEESQRILDHLVLTISDHRLLAELFYKMSSAGEGQQENAAKIAQRILQNPAFLQNSRRFTTDVRLMESTLEILQKQDRLETVMPMLETRLRGLRDRTDSRILTATLYRLLNRQDEAKALALELAQHPTSEPERRQIIVSLLIHFGLQRELETMNRLLLERKH